MNANVIIVPDTHIGKNISMGKVATGTSINSRVEDQFNLLDYIFDCAIENGVNNIIFTGDIFENVKPEHYLITLFISWLKKCQVYQIKVHIILGNHDIIRKGTAITSSLDIISEIELDNVTVYKQTDTIFIESSAFTLMPFKDRKYFGTQSNVEALSLLKDSLIYELASIPATYHKILVGHLAIEGSIPVGDEIDDISNELFCPLDMFTGYDYVWMGHVHTPQVMNKNPYISHIGSMDISNFTESEQKKHIVIIDCNSGKFITQNLPTRSLKKIEIIVPKDVNTTDYIISEIEKIKSTVDNSIVKLDISLSSPELLSANKSKIEKLLLDSGVSHVAGFHESKNISLIKKDENNIISSKIDTISAIKKYAEIYIDEKLRSDFIDLSMEIYQNFKLEEK